MEHPLKNSVSFLTLDPPICGCLRPTARTLTWPVDSITSTTPPLRQRTKKTELSSTLRTEQDRYPDTYRQMSWDLPVYKSKIKRSPKPSRNLDSLLLLVLLTAFVVCLTLQFPSTVYAQYSTAWSTRDLLMNPFLLFGSAGKVLAKIENVSS